jgi:hypothetical protein
MLKMYGSEIFANLRFSKSVYENLKRWAGCLQRAALMTVA